MLVEGGAGRAEPDPAGFWWIHSPREAAWAGLRIAVFDRTSDGQLIMSILGEWDPNRIGIRHWDTVHQTEGWVKVQAIPKPEGFT